MTLGGSGRAARSVPARRGGDPRKGPRRRGTALERAILQATWDEVVAVGYANLTMEGVAARAGTSKAVLYRRWPSRAELVLAAMRQQRPMLSGDVPDTGALRSDVLALLRRFAKGFDEVGQELIYGLLADVFRDSARFSHLQTHSLQLSTDTMLTILRRAAERGEVDLDKVTRRMATLPLDLVRHELFTTRVPVPEATLTEIVDDIFLPLVRA